MNDKLAKQLTELAYLPTPFAKNLNDKGVVASSKETLNSLIDKIPLIPTIEGDLTLETKTITQDGDYFPINDGVDAYSSVSVNIINDNNALVKFLDDVIGTQRFKRIEIRGNIPSYTFQGRSDLKEVYLIDCEEIAEHGFYNCANLLTLVNNISIKKIGEYAFFQCSNLDVEIKLDDEMTIIPPYCFQNCTKLKVNIPKSLESIGISGYRACLSLVSDTLPENLKSIGNYAFYNCPGLTAKIMPPMAVSMHAFSYSGVQFEEIPEGTTLSTYAFNYCDGLTNLKFSYSGVIPNYCFQYCKNLESIEIGKNITAINAHVFRGCSKLKTITCHNTTLPTLTYTAINSCPIETIYVPASALETYKSATNWSAYADKMIGIEGE